MSTIPFPGLYPAWRADGRFTTGAFELRAAAAAGRYNRINWLHVTNSSVASGVSLVITLGGRFMHSLSCAARFTTAFQPPATGWGDHRAGQAWNLSLSGGPAAIAFSCIGHVADSSTYGA